MVPINSMSCNTVMLTYFCNLDVFLNDMHIGKSKVWNFPSYDEIIPIQNMKPTYQCMWYEYDIV